MNEATTALTRAGVTRGHRAPPTQSAILSTLRGFLRFVKAVDPATSVPDSHLLPSPRRNPPYILTAEQLQLILHAATTARPRGGLRADAYVAILGLLASSGLRISEALHLKETDVHLRDEPPHVVVRETKFKNYAASLTMPIGMGKTRKFSVVNEP
ncbi:putative integrase (plasmid) [Cupriavidus necator]|uniref:Putative integrase n=1 Tax=Cupriavidus necator TaxID=106590 RepID=A0A1U9V332_CUPNE|nr:hypothetical protein [Cupriavidus necator]AQV99352.1 putative integrase [Cupriavidus necator]